MPVTLVGGVGSGYAELLAVSAKGLPVDGLVSAVERQAALSRHLGTFMRLIVKLDEANMRSVRDSWERHGRPASLRELLQARRPTVPSRFLWQEYRSGTHPCRTCT